VLVRLPYVSSTDSAWRVRDLHRDPLPVREHQVEVVRGLRPAHVFRVDGAAESARQNFSGKLLLGLQGVHDAVLHGARDRMADSAVGE
jgi:hypothetical protein